CEPETGRAISRGQDAGAGLLRRSGDEKDAGQGQPCAGQRDPEETAGMSTTSRVERIAPVRSLPALRTETGATVVLVLGALFALRFVLLASLKYAGNAYGWDMAIYNQCISNIAFHGVPISTAYSDATINHFGIHFSPIYYLIAIPYRFAPSPVTLAGLQIAA